MTKLAYAVCLVSLLALGACKGTGNKCQKAIEKSLDLVAESATAMAGESPELEEAQAKMRAEAEKGMPAAVEKCEAARKTNPQMDEALDCIIAAGTAEDAAGCDVSVLDGLM